MSTETIGQIGGGRAVGADHDFAVRFHGRGGQGVVTAAELLSIAAFFEGRFAQAFPTFGSERAGAPVAGYCRISDKEIRTRSPVADPDALVILDATLVHQVDLFSGLTTDGYLLFNTPRRLTDLGLSDVTSRLHPERCATVPANELALEHLGRPVPNCILLGALSALCGVVSLDSVHAAIRDRFSGIVAEENITAAGVAYDLVRAGLGKEAVGVAPD